VVLVFVFIFRDISVVNERWLFKCVECWDRIDEKLYFDIEVNR
jgi:hypothetical protein